MSRPIDFGVVERFLILRRISKRHSMSFKDYMRCHASLIGWANNIFFKLLPKKPLLAIRFALSNLFKNPDKPLFVALELYLFTSYAVKA